MGTYFSFQYMVQALPDLLSYLDVTVVLTVIAEAAALVLGCLVAMLRVRNVKVLKNLCAVYVSFIRGTPFLVQLYLICFGLPRVMEAAGARDMRAVPVLLFVFLVMVLHSGAYIAEILRGSIESIDKGQLEACCSIGMTTFQAYHRIILPQAFKLAIPALSNEVISTLKNTSLVFNVGVVDMMSKAELMASYSYRSLELYLDVGLIYIVLCFICYGLTSFFERSTQSVKKENILQVKRDAAVTVE
ncbi:amino acid ABC transporter permease [uncultured Acidaminococcus sp.]|uniref:amino acid ABC transporter permease n=1 Tax=uncultured Acidaminococcus sp. TaxID=352152 RepID=UPI0026DBB747|nr:amino acid ABC transporter permease [uncultured Acidaminococcus sp.]